GDRADHAAGRGGDRDGVHAVLPRPGLAGRDLLGRHPAGRPQRRGDQLRHVVVHGPAGAGHRAGRPLLHAVRARPGGRVQPQAPGAPMTLLEVEDLTVSYRIAGGEAPAVRGVSFSLDPGSKLGVAGESGCGKSTVALALLRLLPKTARIGGSIRVDGEDVIGMRWGRLRAVRWAGASIVFQGAMHSLNAVRRVGDQIAEPILLHGTAPRSEVPERVGTLLERVGLPRWRSRSYPHELSGGQRQRVMIAMALACEPKLIVADEPTTALDVMIQAQILRLIDE